MLLSIRLSDRLRDRLRGRPDVRPGDHLVIVRETEIAGVPWRHVFRSGWRQGYVSVI